MTASSRDQYDAILRVGEALTITLGATMAAWLRVQGPGSAELRSLKEAYLKGGVSSGHWHDVVRAAEKIIVTEGLSMPGFIEGVRLGRRGAGLLPDLRLLLEERNLWAHGAGPASRMDATRRVARCLPALEDALERISFLAQMPWILVYSSSYRRQGDFAIQAGRAMGDHPEFEGEQITSSMPLADDTFYAITPGAPIDLTPFVVIRHCETCQQSEVFHSDRLLPKGVALKSFGRGHMIFDQSLRDEICQIDQMMPPESPRESGLG